MAKSKSGGTRSYIRGRVGADVYSIGKDAKGAKQQVVRSLAETVANPQTVAQMTGRMIMSTVMQAVSALKPIIDHSFDNVPKGQPSISEFISRNYALIKADVAAHPASGNSFMLNQYHERGVEPGLYIVSNGDAQLPAALTQQVYGGKIQLASDTATVADLKEALGYSEGDYITAVTFSATQVSGTEYAVTTAIIRINIKAGVADSTVITASNADTIFDIDANADGLISITVGDGKTSIILGDVNAEYGAGGVILTKSIDGSFKHSTCVLQKMDNSDNHFGSAVADVVLPTYPVGSEMFLNGGDL